MIMPDDPGRDKDVSTISADHAEELAASAIPLQVALDAGVYTARSAAELPDWARWIASDDAFPALVYPMHEPDGSATGQVKPVPGSVTSSEGHERKYVSPSKDHNPPKLPVLRSVDDPEKVLIVEGVKQALAVLSTAPENWSIYRIAGIWSWSVSSGVEGVSGTPTRHLRVVQGHDVVIIPDADTKSNVRVFDGAAALGEACTGYGAKSVKFVRLPGAGKDGVDDLLASLPSDDARREMLKSWVSNAKSKPADLDQRQLTRMRKDLREKRNSEAASAPVEAPDGRVPVDVGGDARQASLDLLDALIKRSGGRHIFQREGALVRVRRSKDGKGNDGPLKSDLLTRSGLRRELYDAVYPYSIGPEGPSPTRLSDMVVDLVADHHDRLPWLSGITRSPVVLADGTILTRSGYHADSGVYLDLTSDLEGIEVPDHPNDAEIAAARTLIRDDLFAMDGADGYDGWAFASVADQTHAVAGLITPIVRQIVTKVPMLLFDGIHRGVGKGGCVDLIHRIAFGSPASFMTAPTTDEEFDKRITAKLADSADSIVFDEVQDENGSRLESNSLGAALTSESYEGRRLGKTEMLALPNRATWFGLGNNIEIPGDMVRRVYTCRMSSDRDDLETRDNFRHDLETWVPEHRTELLRAVLIMVRAWYDRGQPEAPRAFGFKSFSDWQRVVGGILHLAGINEFLSTVLEVRENADSEAVDNAEHWEWVESTFPAGIRFSASEVIAQAKADPDAPPPYGRTWEDLTPKELSTYYGRHPRWYAGLRIREDGKLHGKKKAYVCEFVPKGTTALSPPVPTSSTPSTASRPAAGAAPGEVIEMTDPKGFKHEVARAMPPMEGTTIAELGGDAS